MSLDLEQESEKKESRKRNSLRFSYSVLAPTLAKMNYIRDFIDIEKNSMAQRELERVFGEYMYKYIAHIFEPLGNFNIIVVPRAYNPNEEAVLVKVIQYLKGWGNAEVKRLVSVIAEKADTLKALGLHPLQVLHTLESTVRIREDVEQKVAGSLGTEVPVHAKAEASYSKAEHREIEATVTPEAVKMAVTAVLDSISKPTILVLSEKELESLGADTILNATVANRNVVIVLWFPSSPSQEFVKLVLSERVATTFMPILKGTFKSHLVNTYVEVAKQLTPGIFQHRRQLRRGLSNTITLLINTGLLQRVIDKYLDDLVDPLLVVDAANRYVAKMYGLMMFGAEKLLDTYRTSGRSVQKTIERELYALTDVVAHEAATETILMLYGQETLKNLSNMLLSVSESSTLLSYLQSIGREVLYPVHVDKPVEFMRKMGILALKATREGVYRLAPGVKYLYNVVKSMIEASAHTSQLSTVEQ